MKTHNTHLEEILLDKVYQQSVDMKPNGLWYSYNHEWVDFCSETKMEIYDKNYVLNTENINIIIISNKEELDIFVKTYSVIMFGMKIIDWELVSKSYSGIELKNYRSYRRNYTWLYGWDIDSGCIWDLNNIIIQ